LGDLLLYLSLELLPELLDVSIFEWILRRIVVTEAS
jgi:hypothetical protein